MSGTSPTGPERGPRRTLITPSAGVSRLPKGFRPPGAAAGILRLDGNEGALPDGDLALVLSEHPPTLLSEYPTVRSFEATIAERHAVDPQEVMVGAGADELLDRFVRAVLDPSRGVVLTLPTFEMLPRYIALAGAEAAVVPWMSGPFPIDRVLAAITPRTAVAAFVSPNNPTGAAAGADDLRRLSAALPNGLVLVDLAYAEYADEDLTQTALALPNTVVFRTFSKAWGLAGLRIGYAIGPLEAIDWMRMAGSPFTANAAGLALAAAWLERGAAIVRLGVERVKRERRELAGFLEARGAKPLPSQGNFVLARFDDAGAVRRALMARRIAVKEWTNRPELSGYLRITCPGDDVRFERLLKALGESL